MKHTQTHKLEIRVDDHLYEYLQELAKAHDRYIGFTPDQIAKRILVSQLSILTGALDELAAAGAPSMA